MINFSKINNVLYLMCVDGTDSFDFIFLFLLSLSAISLDWSSRRHQVSAQI